jgi:hypothetical protein
VSQIDVRGGKGRCILIAENVELCDVACYTVYNGVDSQLKFGKMKGEEKCTIRLFP